MIAPFIREKFCWIESDTCWWCGSARQTREHLFKERVAWKKEIRKLWENVGNASGAPGAERNMSAKMYKKGFLFGKGAERDVGG